MINKQLKTKWTISLISNRKIHIPQSLFRNKPIVGNDCPSRNRNNKSFIPSKLPKDQKSLVDLGRKNYLAMQLYQDFIYPKSLPSKQTLADSW